MRTEGDLCVVCSWKVVKIAISDALVCKIFWGSMPPDPPRKARPLGEPEAFGHHCFGNPSRPDPATPLSSLLPSTRGCNPRRPSFWATHRSVPLCCSGANAPALVRWSVHWSQHQYFRERPCRRPSSRILDEGRRFLLWRESIPSRCSIVQVQIANQPFWTPWAA